MPNVADDRIALLQVLHGLGFNQKEGESLDAWCTRALVKLSLLLDEAKAKLNA